MSRIRLGGGAWVGVVMWGCYHLPAATWDEDFAVSPDQRQWRTMGDATCFRWDEARQRLAVTWDSSKPNSYFCRPLGTVLSKQDDFSFGFTLTLEDVAVGSTPGKPFTFELAVGLLNLAQATGSQFRRGTGMDSPNLVEWNYFPDSGFGATVAGAIISSQHQWATSFNSPVELAAGKTYAFALAYRAAERTMSLAMTVDGATTPLQPIVLKPEYDDFRVDTLAISSYSDAGQDPMYAGSILAHGGVDNLWFTLPPPPIRDFTGGPADGVWQATFLGRAGWVYALEASEDLRAWTGVALPTPGSEGAMSLTDPRPASPRTFYRVWADKP